MQHSRFTNGDSIIGYEGRETSKVENSSEGRDDGFGVFKLRREERDEDLYYELL